MRDRYHRVGRNVLLTDITKRIAIIWCVCGGGGGGGGGAPISPSRSQCFGFDRYYRVVRNGFFFVFVFCSRQEDGPQCFIDRYHRQVSESQCRDLSFDHCHHSSVSRNSAQAALTLRLPVRDGSKAYTLATANSSVGPRLKNFGITQGPTNEKN